MQDYINRMLSDYFWSLSHPTRIQILQLLRDKGEMCVCEIVEILRKDQSNISRHLNVLKRNGIVEFRAEGVKSFYKIKQAKVYKILDLVKSILHKQTREGQKILEAF